MEQTKAAVLVIGASFGIGRAVALRFAQGGYHAALCGRNRDGLQETARQILSTGGACSIHKVDIGDADAVHRLFEEVSQYGPLNVLWNGASGFLEGRVEDLSPADVQSLFQVGAIGAINVAAHFLRQATGTPLIYNVTCDWDFPKTAGIASFIAAKKALEGFSVALQKERSGDVRVCIVAPADVATHTHPQGATTARIVEETGGAAISPSEIADLCFRMNQYESLFVHRVTIRPWNQKFDVTYQ